MCICICIYIYIYILLFLEYTGLFWGTWMMMHFIRIYHALPIIYVYIYIYICIYTYIYIYIYIGLFSEYTGLFWGIGWWCISSEYTRLFPYQNKVLLNIYTYIYIWALFRIYRALLRYLDMSNLGDGAFWQGFSNQFYLVNTMCKNTMYIHRCKCSGV